MISGKKNADVSRTQGGVSCDSYSFWNFFRQGITVKFHHCRICVTGFRKGGPFSPPPPPPPIREQPRKSPS